MDRQRMCFADLSDDLVRKILLRLQTKSLIRFKCVCKSWNSYISNPRSIAEHLVHTQDQNFRIILTSINNSNQKDVISLFSENLDELQDLPYDKIFVGIDLANDLKLAMKTLCCNHLLCLKPCNNDKIILYNLNPEETEFKILPECDIPLNPLYANRWNSEIGIGFDSNTIDYKVVRLIITLSHGIYMPYILQIEIYSLRSDSWRKLDNVPHKALIYSSVGSMYINGKYYWYGSVGSVEARKGLLSFDMSTESFDFTPLPFSDRMSISIFVLNDRPGLIRTPNWQITIREFEVFALLEHGAEESWTILYSIRPLPGIRQPTVLGFWKNGELFMQSQDGELYLYEPFTDKFRNLHIPAKLCCCQILHYRNSEQNSNFKILKLMDNNLTTDIIKKILLKMQLKNLIKCKSVCKLWNSIILDPVFIAKYLVQNEDQSYRTIVKYFNSVSCKYLISWFPSENLSEFLLLPNVTIFNGTDFRDELLNGMDIFSCNHLICLKTRLSSEIIIWNPKETTFEILPKPDDTRYFEIGFGFDIESGDYKVVRIVRRTRKKNNPYLKKIEICSLQRKYWRELENIPTIDYITSSSGSMYINGRYYWYGSIGLSKGLLSFDMHTELFDVTPLPPNILNSHLKDINILLINDCPGMIYTRNFWPGFVHPHIDIWALLEHGVNESWIFLYSVPRFTALRRKAVIGCWRNGELFMEGVNGMLYRYDPIQNNIFNVSVHGNHKYFQILKYRNSA